MVYLSNGKPGQRILIAHDQELGDLDDRLQLSALVPSSLELFIIKFSYMTSDLKKH